LLTGLAYSEIAVKYFRKGNAEKPEPMPWALLLGILTAAGAAVGGFFLLAWVSGYGPIELAWLIAITLIAWAIIFRPKLKKRS
jgi:hypothetical protein